MMLAIVIVAEPTTEQVNHIQLTLMSGMNKKIQMANGGIAATNPQSGLKLRRLLSAFLVKAINRERLWIIAGLAAKSYSMI